MCDSMAWAGTPIMVGCFLGFEAPSSYEMGSSTGSRINEEEIESIRPGIAFPHEDYCLERDFTGM